MALSVVVLAGARGSAGGRGVVVPSPPSRTCDEAYTDRDATGTFYEAGGARYTMWALGDFYNADLAGGSFIGVVELLPSSTGTPKLFPALSVGQHGCVHFKRDQGAPKAAHAFYEIWEDNGHRHWPIPHAAFCHGDSSHQHPPHAPPHTEPDPDTCPRGDSVTATFSNPPGQPVTVSFVFQHDTVEAGLRNALTDRGGLAPDLIDKWVRAFAAVPGPWYPCSAISCCRVFSS